MARGWRTITVGVLHHGGYNMAALPKIGAAWHKEAWPWAAFRPRPSFCPSVDLAGVVSEYCRADGVMHEIVYVTSFDGKHWFAYVGEAGRFDVVEITGVPLPHTPIVIDWDS